MYKHLIIKSLVVVALSCNTSKISSISWLEGTWKSPITEHNQGETWTKNGQNSWLGKAWSVQANDTIYSETMRIYSKNDSLFLEVIHGTENDGEPVIFTEIYNSSKKMTFEKRNHDWPHFITYWREGRNILKAHVGSYSLDETQLYFNWEKVD